MVIARYPPLMGGTEASCHHLSTWLSHRGWDVRVVTGRWNDLAENEEMDRVPVDRLEQSEKGFFRNQNLQKT